MSVKNSATVKEFHLPEMVLELRDGSIHNIKGKTFANKYVKFESIIANYLGNKYARGDSFVLESPHIK